MPSLYARLYYYKGTEIVLAREFDASIILIYSDVELAKYYKVELFSNEDGCDYVQIGHHTYHVHSSSTAFTIKAKSPNHLPKLNCFYSYIVSKQKIIVIFL